MAQMISELTVHVDVRPDHEHPLTTLYALTLDYPASLNKLYTRNRQAVFLTPEAKAYKLLAAQQARMQFRDANGPIDPLTKPIAVYLTFYRAGKALDIDNGVKLLFDALNGIVWHDDSIIDALHLYKRFDEGGMGPRVEVEICLL